MNALSSAALLVVLGFSSTAMAQNPNYCARVEDNLVSWTMTAGRNAWARKCGFITPAREITLNEWGDYVIFLEGCYSFPNIPLGSTCRRYVPVSESEACIPINEITRLGYCQMSSALARDLDVPAHHSSLLNEFPERGSP